MNQNKLSFESENLVVDYITFKFQDLDNLHQTRIAKDLFQLGFNSYQESGKLAEPIKEPIFVHSKNQFQVCFVRDNSYWRGTLLHFSGINATRFYFFLKEERIDWTILSSNFLVYFAKLLPLQHSYLDYLDWLVVKLRPIRKQPSLPSGLNSDYIQSEILADTRNFVMLIQFLNYAQKLDFEVRYIDQIPYRVVVFRLQDFLQAQKNSNNQYQLVKVKQFFKKLQTGILITSFSDTHFQSLVAVPLVKFNKVQKFWVGKVWLAQELFYYKYPFYLPNLFQRKLRKDEFEVQVQVFKIFSSENIQKIFLIKEFFQNYKSRLSNQQKTKMKGYFIQSVKVFQKHHLIENNYKIISNKFFIDTDQLTISNISQGFVIYERLSV